MLYNKQKKIYFYIFIIISFLILNRLKNIYIENRIIDKLKKIEYIECSGLLNITCNLENFILEQNLSNTFYTADIKKMKIVDLNLLNRDAKLIFKNIKISDSKGIFKQIAKMIDLNISLSHKKIKTLNISLFTQDLILNSSFDFKKDDININNFLSCNIEIESKNNCIKKILYELYKIKLLEVKEQEGDDSSLGINRSMGIDKIEPMSLKEFLGEAYDIFLMLLISEIEIQDIVIEYNTDGKITDFLNKIFREDRKNKISITKGGN